MKRYGHSTRLTRQLRKNPEPDAPKPLRYYLCMLCEGNVRLPSMESVRKHLKRVHDLDPDRLIDLGRLDEHTQLWAHADSNAHFIVRFLRERWLEPNPLPAGAFSRRAGRGRRRRRDQRWSSLDAAVSPGLDI